MIAHEVIQKKAYELWEMRNKLGLKSTEDENWEDAEDFLKRRAENNGKIEQCPSEVRIYIMKRARFATTKRRKV